MNVTASYLNNPLSKWKLYCHGWLTIFIALIILPACEEETTSQNLSTDSLKVGDALDGLTGEEQFRFEDGFKEFIEVEQISEGLGPLFNASSCAQCHALPLVGGVGLVDAVHVGTTSNGTFQAPPGGTLRFLFSTRPDVVQLGIPDNANTVARRRPIALFGDGLIEAIPDDTIIAVANASGKTTGITGRVHMIEDPVSGEMRVGRFGWKAQHATLLAFAAEAYRDEMGITNELFPNENAPDGDTDLLELIDEIPDPEAVSGTIDKLADFIRFLAPLTPGDSNTTTRRGDELFNTIGCADCHTPQMTTGTNSVQALNNKVVSLFSDLLLHDVGTGDGIQQGDAAPNEIRTPPLWGVSSRKLFLHDGRAKTISEAISMHAGEAETVRDNFDALTEDDKNAIIEFLNSI